MFFFQTGQALAVSVEFLRRANIVTGGAGVINSLIHIILKVSKQVNKFLLNHDIVRVGGNWWIQVAVVGQSRFIIYGVGLCSAVDGFRLMMMIKQASCLNLTF